MPESLKKRTIKGIAWSAIDKVAVRGVQFVVNIIIARVLMPADYGAIGMIMVFITLSNLLIDSGFSQALVQKQDRTQVDMSTAFYFNIIIALSCYCILYVVAPFIASFYDISILSSVLRVIGLSVIFNSLCTVQRANLLIKIDFKTLAISNVVCIIISGMTGLFLAYSGWGVWALVGQTLTQQGLSAILLWLLGRWHPLLKLSKDSVKQLWRFGSKLLAAGAVATIVREINTIVIGKFYRASELGYYHRAIQTTDLVSNTTNEVINVVTFPVLSSVQNDRDRLVAIYHRMLSLTAFCILPVMTLIAIIAEPLVCLLLTEKWLPIVPLIQWLCFSRIFTPVNALNMNILNAVGRSDLYLKADLSKIPIIVVVMAITLPISVDAVVIGNVISSFICYFINAYYPGKLFGSGIIVQYNLFKPTILSTICMAVFAIGTIRLFEDNILKLLLTTFVAFITYIGASILFKSQNIHEIWRIIKERKNK